MEKSKQIELRSEKVRNIVGQVPPLLLRYGISIIALSLLMLVVVAAFLPCQPAIETKISVMQDEMGRLHYSAGIQQDALKKQSHFVYIISGQASELYLPGRFRITMISDTAHISPSGVWFRATLEPMEAFDRAVQLEKPVTFPAKIVLEKRSMLKWIWSKIFSTSR